MSLFAYSEAGFVLAHENQVRVWDSKIDGPRWWRPLSSKLIGVGSAGSLITTLEQNGQLAVWDANGMYVGGNEFAQATGLATTSNGAAVACASRVELFGAHGRWAHPIAGVSTLRFSANGSALGLGFHDGRVLVIDPGSGATIAVGQLPGGSVTGVAERAPGEWLATAGSAVHLLKGDQVSRVTGLGDTQITDVCAGPRSSMFAITAGQLAVALEWPSRDTICSCRYADKTPLGVAFGAPGDDGFYVGLTGGDGNRRDLRTGDLYRTDPHPTHERNRWIVMPGYEQEVALRALSRP